MSTLAQIPCLWLRPEGQPAAAALRLAQVFPGAIALPEGDPATRRDAMAEALAGLTCPQVLVLPGHVLPRAELARAVPDPLLVSNGLRIGWMARNAVTGELISRPGPRLWTRAALAAHLDDPVAHPAPPLAVMPQWRADWAFNVSSGAAFGAGHDHASQLAASGLPESETAARLAVAASVGADVRFGEWWRLGVLCAALGTAESPALAYRHETARHERLRDTSQRLRDLSRRARLELGLNIQPLSPAKSSFFRSSRFVVPPKTAFDTLADCYDGLGSAGAASARRWRQAAAWVWGGDGADPMAE